MHGTCIATIGVHLQLSQDLHENLPVLLRKNVSAELVEQADDLAHGVVASRTKLYRANSLAILILWVVRWLRSPLNPLGSGQSALTPIYRSI